MNGGCAVVHSGTIISPDGVDMMPADIVACRGVIRSSGAGCGHDPVHVDADGAFVSPGLVDLHLHGALGHDLTDPDPAAWTRILDHHLHAGTTTVLATLATTTPERTAAALATAAALLGTEQAPTLAGVHLEGPCLDAAQRGAHDPALLRSARQLRQELTPIPPALRMVTLAPELSDVAELITHLSSHGIRVSAGHSSATTDDLAEAQRLGLVHLAHLWSGQSTLTRPDIHRIPGLLEASLASRYLTAEVIADGHHLPAELLTIALRCFGPDRLCLVSDATAGTGLPPGQQFTVGAVSGVTYDGYAATEDRTSLCGSVIPLADSLGRMHVHTGATVAEVLMMATGTPARVAGLYPRKGSLAPGTDADLLTLESDLSVRMVLLAGRPVTGATQGGVW